LLFVQKPFFNLVTFTIGFYGFIPPSAGDVNVFVREIGSFKCTSGYGTTQCICFVYSYIVLASITVPLFISGWYFQHPITFLLTH
jgi:hypothetical protein